jgi:tetratricopeptide (TPR) repeat protein
MATDPPRTPTLPATPTLSAEPDFGGEDVAEDVAEAVADPDPSVPELADAPADPTLVTSTSPSKPPGFGSTPPGAGRRDDALAHGVMIGRYMVLRKLGRGGVGTVYAAHDPKLDRQVALKLLHSARGDAPERLVREAQALARLTDPHVVAVYDAGEIDGRVFIAMQLVDGADLATALGRRRPGVAQLLGWFVQAGQGLAAAHAAGLVHRDFKPSNVLIDHRGNVAVTDFGLVRGVASDARGLTGMGDILGTPAYMSPEQHGLQPATPASDQFSFCVALWEALFAQHPFVDGDRGSMSPFEIGYKIYDGDLIPPPRATRVPRRVIEALERGLTRDPDGRWPTMDALLAELTADGRRSVAPYVAGGLAAAVIGGIAVYAVVGRGDGVAACKADAQHRVDSAWTAALGAKVREAFASTGRAYADAAAAQATSGLDRYAGRWRAIAGDVCAAEAAGGADVAARRRACLDGRLDALRGVVALFSTKVTGEFVDHAQAMVDGLPELGDCTGADAVAAVAAPPANQAAEATALDVELALATARDRGGDPSARGELVAIAAKADALGWAPLRVRAHLAVGLAAITGFDPPGDDLTLAATLATEHGLDRDAARAWAGATVAAGLARRADVVAALAPIAKAAAARTGERYLAVDADVAHGRALSRLGKYQEAGAACKPALAAAQALARDASIDPARDCLIEALAAQGAFAEVQPMIDARIADTTAALGEHPRVADYLTVRASMFLRTGKAAEARADAERALAIRTRTFPPRHWKVAEAMHGVAQVTLAEGKYAEAKQLFAEALAIATEASPEPLILLGSLHTMLGFIAQGVDGDLAGAMKHFADAIAVIRKRGGADSLELGVLLSNYGQIQAAADVDAGLATLAEARAILDRLGDKRGILVATAIAEVEANAGRWTSARAHAEEMLAKADADADPVNVALAKWILARAIVETRGDRARAHALAVEARAVYAQLGKAQEAELAKLDAWLRAH